MSELVATPEIKSAATFAGLLESFTASAKSTNKTWDDSALLDDVATISYEQALRTHRRVPSAASLAGNQSHSQSAAPPPLPPGPSAVKEKKRKSASITIRLTEAEEIQLHQRAASAQLSVSAYLRSCIFEAESLRTQVKEALATLRAAPAIEPQPSAQKQSTSAKPRRFHLFQRWSHRPASNS